MSGRGPVLLSEVALGMASHGAICKVHATVYPLRLQYLNLNRHNESKYRSACCSLLTLCLKQHVASNTQVPDRGSESLAARRWVLAMPVQLLSAHKEFKEQVAHTRHSMLYIETVTYFQPSKHGTLCQSHITCISAGLCCDVFMTLMSKKYTLCILCLTAWSRTSILLGNCQRLRDFLARMG